MNSENKPKEPVVITPASRVYVERMTYRGVMETAERYNGSDNADLNRMTDAIIAYPSEFKNLSEIASEVLCDMIEYIYNSSQKNKQR